MSLHEILRGPAGTLSGILPATPLKVGTPMMISAVDATTGAKTFAVAAGKCDGFLTRESRAIVGLTDEEQLFGFGLETPFTVSKEGSIEQAEELIVEGDDYILDEGTGAIAADTAADTMLSFSGGKFSIAQPGDLAQFRLVKQMTPEVSGNIRILVRKIEGYVVPEPAA